MTGAESLAQLVLYTGDSTITTYEHLSNSLLYLSNFFYLEEWDESVVTTANQNYVDVSAKIFDIESCFVNEVEIEKLPDKDFQYIPKYEENLVERFYFTDNKLFFTVAPSETGLAVRIKVKKRYTMPLAGASYDCPDNILPLVILGALENYYTKLLSTVALNRDNAPDIKPSEILTLKNDISKTLTEKITLIKKNVR